MIVIVDYGMGNLGSVKNMFKRIGVESIISSDPKIIENSTKILLPGVGAFDAAVQALLDSGLKDLLYEQVIVRKKPILGICLGMQLLTKGSEEGVLPGLGWVDAYTHKFNFKDNSNLKVPHMGWNHIFVTKSNELLRELPTESKFYFVHSYYVKCLNRNNVLATTLYGDHFHSVINHENIYGAQFHPEKSHKYGMRLLENFSIL